MAKPAAAARQSLRWLVQRLVRRQVARRLTIYVIDHRDVLDLATRSQVAGGATKWRDQCATAY
ncbi:MAG TPA: hypothetical protein VJ717_15245 [Gemmatimonadaceae bacterium]|nr:hypothetical protein [Gemmatimonadaceae bacterium]